MHRKWDGSESSILGVFKLSGQSLGLSGDWWLANKFGETLEIIIIIIQ